MDILRLYSQPTPTEFAVVQYVMELFLHGAAGTQIPHGMCRLFLAIAISHARLQRFHMFTLGACRCLSFVCAFAVSGNVVLGFLAFLLPSFGLCQKCDGDHSTSHCPHFARARETDQDAWTHFGNVPALAPEDGNNVFLRGATVLRQPGDGHCLFHSLGTGLQQFGQKMVATILRRETCHFLRTHAEEMYGDSNNTWTTWVQKDSGYSVNAYCREILGDTERKQRARLPLSISPGPADYDPMNLPLLFCKPPGRHIRGPIVRIKDDPAPFSSR